MGWRLVLQYQVAHPGRKKGIKKALPIEIRLFPVETQPLLEEVYPDISDIHTFKNEVRTFEPVFSRYAKHLRAEAQWDQDFSETVEKHLEQLQATNVKMQADGYALEWSLDS